MLVVHRAPQRAIQKSENDPINYRAENDVRASIKYLIFMIKCKIGRGYFEEALEFISECNDLVQETKEEDPEFYLEHSLIMETYFHTTCKGC